MRSNKVVISCWFKELSYNPICKVGELEKSLGNYFQAPFLINDCEPFINVGMPRIVARSDEAVFDMSLINANLSILHFYTNNIDDIMLKVNEMMQLVFDILCDLYEIECIYTSIKIELVESSSIKKCQKELLGTDEEIEDFMVKKSIRKDDKYYFNTMIILSKEVSFDIKNPSKNKPNESDLLARSMLISLCDSKVKDEVKNTVLEINNRLAYNVDNNYRVNKDEVRDLLFEFKVMLNKEIKEKK